MKLPNDTIILDNNLTIEVMNRVRLDNYKYIDSLSIQGQDKQGNPVMTKGYCDRNGWSYTTTYKGIVYYHK